MVVGELYQFREWNQELSKHQTNQALVASLKKSPDKHSTRPPLKAMEEYVCSHT